jgi:hypothetical protein
MSPTLLTSFAPDPERLAPLLECMEAGGNGDADAEWPNNLISRKTVVYGSGRISREGIPVQHAVDPDELARCQRLAGQAAALMEGVQVGMGSESRDPFQPFFIAANHGQPIPHAIDESLIWAAFGGTIFPLATITVEPLEPAGIWWSEVVSYLTSDEEDEEVAEEQQAELARWHSMRSWFQQQADFKVSAFIRIGEYRALSDLEEDAFPPGTEIPGCVLPRLALGLTQQGSLVGLFGYSVQT